MSRCRVSRKAEGSSFGGEREEKCFVLNWMLEAPQDEGPREEDRQKPPRPCSISIANNNNNNTHKTTQQHTPTAVGAR